MAFLLALALVVSVMSGLGLSVSAEQESNTPGTEEVQQQDKTEAGAAPSEVKAEEKAAKPEEKPVLEEKEDEQKTEAKENADKPAEKQEKATPKAGENVQTATIGTGDKTVTVKTTAAAGVLPEGAKLVVKKLANQDQAYQDAESTLKDSQVTYDDFLALDVGFEVNGKEVEPEAGSVQVQFELGAGLLPETADTSTLAVQHLTDGKAETVADAGAVTAGDVKVNSEVIKADFEVNSFSTFTITWGSGKKTYFQATVYYVDEKGNEIDTGTEANVSATGNQTLDIKKEYGHDISGYTYSTVRYQNPTTGQEIAQIKTTEKTTTKPWGGSTTTRTVTLVMLDGTTQELSNNTSTKIYLVYTKNTEGGHTGPSQTLAHEKYVTYLNNHTYDLNLTVSGKKGSKANKAKVDVLLILDRSGSMGETVSSWGSTTKMQQVASAVQTLTDNLKNNENIDARYSVVSFADTATTDQDWTSSAGAAYAAVAKATTNEGTNYQAGIYKAKKQLESSRSGAQTMVIFLTDGAPTYQGQTTASGEGSFTEQRYIDAAKNELRGMTADGFYCVGVMLDSTITVYTANGTDFWGDTKWESEEKTGKAILQEIIAGGTNIKDKPAPMMASDPKALNDAFDKIEAKITDLLCDHVIVTDVLSENVKMVTNSETDTTPKKLVVTIKKNADGSIVQGPATSVKDGNDEIKAEYDAATKQITLDFPINYTLNPDYTYIVTATIEATEKAYENVRVNKGDYPNIGDAGTGETSAGQRGVYSNEDGKAKVSYVYNDSKETEYYNKPVIQLEPAHLIINKTITGLTEEQIDAALKNKLTFGITYTYPNQATDNAQVKLGEVTAGENGEYTFTYTSGDIWSMGATYEVTEKMLDVADYDCVATPDKATGSIPKYSTATATFTNSYTPSNRTITLKKVVTGNMGDKAQSFKFSTTDNATLEKTSLIGGETTTITAKVGETVTITETDPGSYTVSASGVKDGTFDKEKNSYTFTVTKDMNKDDTVITFTNTLQINPPNGITTTIAPYAIMVVLAAGAGVYFVYSRRRRNR